MKKRLLSILLMCCMVLTLLPTTAFAEESTETPPVCTCETACAVETMNVECSVCGAEGASAENCAKYIKPADDAAVQPEGEVSAPQPETALTELIGGSETAKEVSTVDELTKAIADSTISTVKLAGDISISTSLTVKRTVTLDLNGHVLKYEGANNGSVIVVEGSGNLTLTDSNTTAEHKFTPGTNGLWVSDENGSKTVSGGVITGGTGYPILLYNSYYYYGGGVYIASGGQLTMTGGNIIGCSATYGGGVCTDSEQTVKFSMSGGSIAGCVASIIGGGVRASGTFQMSGQAVIRSCTAESATQFVCGGGVYVNGSSSFEMSDEAIIKGCQAISNSSYSSNGGGVYVSSGSSFVMSEKAQIEDCKAISNSSKSSKGGGVFLANGTSLTLSDNAVIQNCRAVSSDSSGEAYGGGVHAFYVREITLADNARIVGCTAANGSGLYITGSQVAGYGKLFANGGSVDGDVVLGDTTDCPCTITGSGRTLFNDKVTVAPGSTIESGIFNGEVINNGTITGGVFTGTVFNNGTITGNPALITGSGTVTDPYQIGTAAGLKWFRDKVNNATKTEDTKICAELTEDIDLSGEAWTPIGIGERFHWGIRYYSGTFDGKGHTIKNLSIDNSSALYVGLFGYVYGGTIRNLTVLGSVKGTGYTGGIAGAANGGTFENCANQCEVQGGTTENDTTGGIIGFAYFGDTLIVRDCYNVGNITGRHAGGIIGQCNNWLETIRNCYNAGTVTGTANAGAIIGNYSSDKIYNCYYLEGSVTRAGYGDKASIAKTATEFADGTVLALLINSRTDSEHLWNSQCQYLAAAGKTLPVFKTQTGDAHTHDWSAWTSNGDGTHSRRCTCNAAETVIPKRQSSGSNYSYYTIKATAGTGGAISPSGNVSVRGGRDQTFTITPDQGYAVSDVKIDGESVGAVTSYSFENVRKAHTIAVSFATIKTFVDVPAGSYYEDAVDWAVENGITQGTDDTHFSPDGICTRAQAVTFLWRTAGSPEPKTSTMPFTDVNAGSYCYDAVLWAVENGITKGTSDTTFSPDATCSRAQIVTFLWRSQKSPAVGSLNPFTDVSANAYYTDAVLWAVEENITKGTTATTFSPDADCSRAQIVTLLYRAYVK